jgi:hypothetical protein
VNTSEPHKAQVRTSGRVPKPHKIHGTPANRLEVITLQAERLVLRKGMIDCGSPSCAKGMAVPRCASWMIVPFRPEAAG